MVCFRHPEAVRIVADTKLFALAESLGGVESLIEVPQAMTHQSVEGSSAAVPADLVRLSCGIEAAADLVEDLRQAIAAVAPAGVGPARPPSRDSVARRFAEGAPVPACSPSCSCSAFPPPRRRARQPGRRARPPPDRGLGLRQGDPLLAEAASGRGEAAGAGSRTTSAASFWGSYRCEKWGKREASLHAENRAIDWHLDAAGAGDRKAARAR